MIFNPSFPNIHDRGRTGCYCWCVLTKILNRKNTTEPTLNTTKLL